MQIAFETCSFETCHFGSTQLGNVIYKHYNIAAQHGPALLKQYSINRAAFSFKIKCKDTGFHFNPFAGYRLHHRHHCYLQSVGYV